MSKASRILRGVLVAVATIAMAIVLASSLVRPAYAAEASAATDATHDLTITGTKTGHTYEAYQVFTGDLSTNEDGDKVLSNVSWGEGVTYKGKLRSAEAVAEALEAGTVSIKDLASDLTLTTPKATVESSAGTTVFEGLPNGYYLVKDKDGTQEGAQDAYTSIIVQVVGDTTVQVKSDVPTVIKKVKDTNLSTGALTDWQDSADYNIGDSIPYQITGTVASNVADYTTYAYAFHDTMSKGLTFNGDAKIMIDGDPNLDVTSQFTQDVVKNGDGTTTVTWSIADLKQASKTLNASTHVVVQYTCTLNEDAVIGAAGNPNEVNLTFSNNPNAGGEGSTGKTPDDKNIVFTYKVVVNKVDAQSKPLAGAAFTLQRKKPDGSYADVKTISADDKTTTFNFEGLSDGIYMLVESTVPEGYNKADDIEFTVTASHEIESPDPKLMSLTGKPETGEIEFTPDVKEGSLTTNVENRKGSTLPSTGGMGTTVLYVGGAAIVLASAVGVIALRRGKKN
jgi:fimbrial isopeptide formation D2 family protein/LPXTG-motif cell wall-anchored protein